MAKYSIVPMDSCGEDEIWHWVKVPELHADRFVVYEGKEYMDDYRTMAEAKQAVKDVKELDRYHAKR